MNDGIYDAFPGYWLPSELELDEALRRALVVVDTNVLLNLYRYNESTRDDLIGVLRALGDRLWVPHQVIREFWRSRLNVLSNRDGSTEQALNAFEKHRRATADALHQWAKAVAIEASERTALLDTIDRTYVNLEESIRSLAPAPPTTVGFGRQDPVLKELESLLNGKVGPPLAPAEWQDAVREGNERATRKVPPGYLDVDKVDTDLPEGAAGDYLVWCQTISEAATRGVDVLLVTGDEKEDWWWRHRSEFIGPRVELVAELKAKCNSALFMMRPVDLLQRAAALEFTVRRESVEEVSRVSREFSERPVWSAAGVVALIKRLETEGREQADVILSAALRGGTIDRQEIYEIGGYSDDRMLRGFTRPTARITSDLQAEGIVLDGVDAALTPVYHGGVKAVAFRIPSEMVDIVREMPGAETAQEELVDGAE